MVGGSKCQDFEIVQHLSACFLRPETFRNDFKWDEDLIKTKAGGEPKKSIPTGANESVVNYYLKVLPPNSESGEIKSEHSLRPS